jgi:flagellar hook assembly protein FlgD
MPARGSAALVVDGAPGATGTATLVDLAGRNVRSWRITLPSDGHHEWRWDARTESGGTAAAGLYFVVVKLGPKTTTHRVVLLR